MVALSVSVRVAARFPVAEGVKITLTVHDPPGDKLEQLFVWEKSDWFTPLIPTLVKFTVICSWLVTTMFFGALLVPTVCPPKLNEAGLKLTG